MRIYVTIPLLLITFAGCKSGSKESSEASPAIATQPSATVEAPSSEPIAEVRPDLKIDAKTLLAEYSDNEVRADSKFKQKFVEVRGTVGEVKKDLTGEVYVTVGTGADVEIPMLQCFAKQGALADFAALSREHDVVVRGRIDGLMMNVLAKDCTVQTTAEICQKIHSVTGEGECKAVGGTTVFLLHETMTTVKCISSDKYASFAAAKPRPGLVKSDKSRCWALVTSRNQNAIMPEVIVAVQKGLDAL